MDKFHINGKGEAGTCRAKKDGCPFGGEAQHYPTADEARAAFEKEMGESFPKDVDSMGPMAYAHHTAMQEGLDPVTGEDLAARDLLARDDNHVHQMEIQREARKEALGRPTRLWPGNLDASYLDTNADALGTQEEALAKPVPYSSLTPSQQDHIIRNSQAPWNAQESTRDHITNNGGTVLLEVQRGGHFVAVSGVDFEESAGTDSTSARDEVLAGIRDLGYDFGGYEYDWMDSNDSEEWRAQEQWLEENVEDFEAIQRRNEEEMGSPVPTLFDVSRDARAYRELLQNVQAVGQKRGLL